MAPALPPGLGLNLTTGVISGTPSGPYSGTYVVVARNTDGSAETTLTITVRDPLARRVGALGDSNTEGTCCGMTRPWVSTLADLLGPNWEVENYGVGGDTTADALARWRGPVRVLPSDVVHAGLGALIVFVGINDVNLGIDSEVSVQNLQAIFDEARSSGLVLIPVTLFPDNQWVFPGRLAAWTRINQFVRSYGRTNGIAVIDTAPAFTDLHDGMDPRWGDGLHLNDAGHDRFAKLIRAVFP